MTMQRYAKKYLYAIRFLISDNHSMDFYNALRLNFLSELTLNEGVSIHIGGNFPVWKAYPGRMCPRFLTTFFGVIVWHILINNVVM